MKVYKIDLFGKPTGTRHKYFASLDCKRTDTKYLDLRGVQRGDIGTPFKSWKEIEMRVYDPGNPRPDLFKFGSNLICGPRAYALVGKVMEQSGQLLPLTVKGEAGTHYFYNCTTLLDAVNPSSSLWLYHKSTETFKIEAPGFRVEKLAEASLFFCREIWKLCVVERTGDFRDGEFKALVEHYGITGIGFDLLWSEEEGLIPPTFRYEPEHPFEYRSADGKPWVFQDAPAKHEVKETKPAKSKKLVDEAETEEPDPRDSYRRKAGPGTTVFEIQSVIPSKAGKPKPAPLLVASPRNREFLAAERFRGHPFPEDWKRVELNFGDHKPWQADFYFYGPGALVCSEKARDFWLAPLEDQGEFFPVKIKDIPGRYFLYNETTCLDALNVKRSTCKKSNADPKARVLLKPFFFAQRLGDECLFKVLDEGGVRMYCIERTGDPYDDEFRVLVECGKLTGLSFKKVWSGGR